MHGRRVIWPNITNWLDKNFYSLKPLLKGTSRAGTHLASVPLAFYGEAVGVLEMEEVLEVVLRWGVLSFCIFWL